MAPGSAWAEVLTLATKEGNESTDVTLAEEDREQGSSIGNGVYWQLGSSLYPKEYTGVP